MLLLGGHLLFYLAAMGFLAGFVDSIAGGGGLITTPALLTIGITPHLALGTNKLAATCGAFNAARIFIKKDILRPYLWSAAILATANGAILGVLVNHLLSTQFLGDILPFLIIGVAIYVGFYRPKSLVPEPAAFKNYQPPKPSSGLTGLILGFYDGCFGPGTGSFWTCTVMMLYRLDLLTASGIARLMNFISNIVALLTFMALNQVNYRVGLMLAVGLLLGSWVGANSAIRFGAKFIRPIFLAVVILMAVNILWQRL